MAITTILCDLRGKPIDFRPRHRGIPPSAAAITRFGRKAATVTTCTVCCRFGTREALLDCTPDYVIDSFGELMDLVRESRG